MLVAVSVCPHPPLLVPAVASGAASAVSPLRDACLQAVRRLTSTGVPHVVVVGSARRDGEWDGSAGGDLRAFGCDVAFGGPDHVLPLSLTIGSHLLDEAGWATHDRHYLAVADDRGAEECAALGRTIADTDTAVALLVMADGSAKRSTAAPGYLDERAARHDAAVVEALEKAHPEALLTLDPTLASQLWVAGRTAWQVLAGAAQTSYGRGASISTAVRYDEAPFGVGYAVVDWTLSYP